MIPDPDIVLAVSTVTCGLSIAATLAAWAERRFPPIALAALALGAGAFAYAYSTIPDPSGWREVPDAFISVAARILN